MHSYDLILTLTGRPRCRARPRLPDAAPGPVAHRRLPARRRRRRPEHARLRRRPASGRAARRGRRHPADVRRRPALPPRGAARRRAASPSRARSSRASSRRSWARSLAHGVRLGLGGGHRLRPGHLAVASTVVLIRVLSDNNDLHTPTGHIAVGWLVVEDLFTGHRRSSLLPGVRRRPRTRSTPSRIGPVGSRPSRSSALVAFTFVVGGRVIPWLLDTGRGDADRASCSR